ncbi:MAG: hypothetical protein ACI4NG_01580, partial [Candidatus Gallimonas sp.]
MEVLSTALFIVGTVIGAGFISGAELVRFFPSGEFVPPVSVSCLLLCAFLFLFLLLGKRHGGYRKGVRELFGRGAPVVFTLGYCSAFVVSAGMIAALDAIAPEYGPLCSACGTVFVCCFLARGTRGLSVLNALLVPLILAFVLVCGGGDKSFSYPVPPANEWNAWGGGAVYAGLNAFLAMPVLMDAGATRKRIFTPALLASATVCVCALFILGSLYREGSAA